MILFLIIVLLVCIPTGSVPRTTTYLTKEQHEEMRRRRQAEMMSIAEMRRSDK